MRDYSVAVDKYPLAVPEMQLHFKFRMFGVPEGSTKLFFIYEYQFYGELTNTRRAKGKQWLMEYTIFTAKYII